MAKGKAQASATVKKAAKPVKKKAAAARQTKAALANENQTTEVDDFMRKLKHPLKAEMEALRSIIKSSNNKIKERVKWNAPSFFSSADMVTFNPRQLKFVQLVFHHAEIVNIKSALLLGEYKDRRLLHLNSMDEVKAHKKELGRIMNELVKRVDK